MDVLAVFLPLLDVIVPLAYLVQNSKPYVPTSFLRNFRLVHDAPRFSERPLEKDQHGKIRHPR